MAPDLSNLVAEALRRRLSSAEIAAVLGADAGVASQAVERFATLVYVASRISDVTDLQELLAKLVAALMEAIGTERGTVFLNDPRTNELFSYTATGGAVNEIRFPNHLGIAGSVFTSGVGVLIPDAYADARFNPAFDKKTGFRTRDILCAPIRTGSGEIIGVTQLLNKLAGGFDAGDLPMLEAATTQAAAALVNARLLAEIEHVRREEAKLQDLARTVSSELHLKPLIEKVTAIVSELLEADRSSVFLNDRKTNELFSYVAQGMGHKEIRFPNHLGIAGSVFTSGEALNIPDAYEDARFNRAVDKATGYRTKSLLTMPIRTREGKILGVTQVINKKSGAPFSDGDLKRLDGFTAQICVAIENATLFQDVENMKNYNEGILASMSNGVLTIDEDGKIRKFNPAFGRIFAIGEGEWVGAPAASLFTGKNEWVARRLTKVVEDRKAHVDVDVDVDLAGNGVSVNLTTVPLVSVNGESLGAMMLFEDLSAEKRLKGTLARYMTKEVADRLIEAGESALGGSCQNAAVLFSDIRSFTTLTEQAGPQETVAMLNEYFAEMVECIFREQGILDKYIGDAIMALFGVPFPHDDDDDRSVRAALAMLNSLDELNFSRIARNKLPINIGIGINTDEVVSGNIGSMKRMDYTVIGDGVNLASRLESSCKTYGVRLMVSEFTRRGLKGQYLMRELDKLVVKGKTQPVPVYEIVNDPGGAAGAVVASKMELWAEAKRHYYAADFRKAQTLFERVLEAFATDKPARLHVERCRSFIETPPPPDWDGVWVLHEK